MGIVKQQLIALAAWTPYVFAHDFVRSAADQQHLLHLALLHGGVKRIEMVLQHSNVAP